MVKKKNKRKPKKRPEINLDEIDPDELLKETVACAILGRQLASYAAMLTGREKTDRELVYLLLKAGRKPSPDLPVTARTSKIVRDNVKKYTPSEAISWFSENHPKAAQPLLKRLEERHSPTDPALSYGLIEGEYLDDEYMIATLQRVLPITRGPARALYEKITSPALQRQEEEGGLIEVAMKK